MSAGHVDEEALAIAARAMADAGKRGLKVVSMTVRVGKEGRSFSFGYQPVERSRRRADPGPTPVQSGADPISPTKVRRGVARPVQESLFQ